MFEDRLGRLSAMLDALLSQEPTRFAKVTPTAIAYDPGVYRVFRHALGPSATVYVGESTNLAERVYQHLMANRRASTLKDKLITRGGHASEDAVKHFLRAECSVQFILIREPEERAAFEHFAIAVLQPEFND